MILFIQSVWVWFSRKMYLHHFSPRFYFINYCQWKWMYLILIPTKNQIVFRGDDTRFSECFVLLKRYVLLHIIRLGLLNKWLCYGCTFVKIEKHYFGWNWKILLFTCPPDEIIIWFGKFLASIVTPSLDEKFLYYFYAQW